MTLTFTLMADENPKENFNTGAKWTEIEKKEKTPTNTSNEKRDEKLTNPNRKRKRHEEEEKRL